MINKDFRMLSIIILCSLILFPLLSQADVILTVGNGSGLPCFERGNSCTCDQADCYQLGASCSVDDFDCYILRKGSLCTNCSEPFCYEMKGPCYQESVPINLENLTDKIKAVAFDICDVDDYLAITACETTDRTADYSCLINEITDPDDLSYGCGKVILLYFGQKDPPPLIEEGTGPIATLAFNVSMNAHEGECRALNVEEAKATDEFFNILELATVDGEFCFPCTYDADCDDGLFCNGEETCDDNGTCQMGTDPCPDQMCDEVNDICVDCLTDEDCDDGLFCNGVETCVGGVCQMGIDPCPPLLCDEVSDECYCDANEQCDDGLFCNGEESCVTGVCQPGTDPCAPDLMCDEDENLCYSITIDIGDGLGFLGSTNNLIEVSLDNPYDKIKGIQVDICDVDDYLSCSECETTGRASGFECYTNELVNGCCRILLFSISGDIIEVGEGSIFTLKYDSSLSAPLGECRALNPENASVSDMNNQPLDATSVSGSFCFPCSENADCDDGLFCNGEEACVGGVCQVGNDPCPDRMCDEVNDICVDCLTDEDCDGASFCNFGVCEPIADTTTTTTIPSTTTTPLPTTTTVIPTTTTTTTTIIPTPECEVTINPSSTTVSSGGTLYLIANTTGESCEIVVYEWSIVDSEIGSVIDQEGNYSAGINNTESQVTDIIKVVDHANSDIYAIATIIVECEQCGKIDTVFPKILLGSRWIPIPYFISIIDKDTTFDKNSTISFEPEEDILLVNQAGFGNIFLAFIFLFNSPQEGIVNFTINNREETVTGEITIKLLPIPFADDYSDSAESYMEIFLDTYTLSDEYSIGGNPL